MSYIPIFVIVVSNLLYHLSQKKLSSGPNPFLILSAAYFFALLISIGFSLRTGIPRLVDIRAIPWLVLVLGVSIVGIEIGFFWAYRAGWLVNSTAIFAHVCLALLLVPVGYLFFSETITIKKMAGLLFALLGLVLLKH